MPKLKGDESRLGGDLALGRNGANLGVLGAGSLNYFAYTNAQRTAQTLFQRAEASADAWWASDPSTTRLEARASLRYDRYVSSVKAVARGSATPSDEISHLGRGVIEVGMRLEPTPDLALGFWIGGGVQYEMFTTEEQASKATGSLYSTSTSTLVINARVRLQAALIRDALVVRFRADVVRFQLTRDTDATDLGASIANRARTVSSSSSSTEVDATNRLFLDAELLRFGRFVPALHAGLDLFIRSSTEIPAFAVVVPLAGAGIRSDVF